jgi:hypothetical protein
MLAFRGVPSCWPTDNERTVSPVLQGRPGICPAPRGPPMRTAVRSCLSPPRPNGGSMRSDPGVEGLAGRQTSSVLDPGSELSVAVRFFPVVVMSVPAGGHRICPVVAAGSDLVDVRCLLRGPLGWVRLRLDLPVAEARDRRAGGAGEVSRGDHGDS